MIPEAAFKPVSRFRLPKWFDSFCYALAYVIFGFGIGATLVESTEPLSPLDAFSREAIPYVGGFFIGVRVYQTLFGKVKQ